MRPFLLLTFLPLLACATAPAARCAWLAVYEKLDGEWRLMAIASTDRPDA
jgi:hypothetical protein